MRVRQVKNRLNAKQRWVVVVMDALLLSELTYVMYVTGQHPETMTPEFLRLFVPMLLGTFVAARILLKRLRTPEPAQSAQSAQSEEEDAAEAAGASTY